MKKVLPLLITAVLLASEAPRASACTRPPLPTLVAMSEYVVVVRVVEERQVKSVRVTEYEVTRTFKGAPPARFVHINRVWEKEQEEADAPKATGVKVLFLTTDPEVTAPWSALEDLARATNGLEVLAILKWEEELAWRGTVGVTDERTEDQINEARQALDPETPYVHSLMPIEAYLETLAAAVETAASSPPPR